MCFNSTEITVVAFVLEDTTFSLCRALTAAVISLCPKVLMFSTEMTNVRKFLFGSCCSD